MNPRQWCRLMRRFIRFEKMEVSTLLRLAESAPNPEVAAYFRRAARHERQEITNLMSMYRQYCRNMYWEY